MTRAPGGAQHGDLSLALGEPAVAEEAATHGNPSVRAGARGPKQALLCMWVREARGRSRGLGTGLLQVEVGRGQDQAQPGGSRGEASGAALCLYLCL